MRLRIGAAVAAVVVLVLLLAIGLGRLAGGSSVSGGGRPFAVRTSLTPGSVFFGDPVVAEVSVDVDKRKVSPGSVHVAPSFTPYEESGTPAVERRTAGDEETIRYRYELVCVTDGCLPTKTDALVQMPPLIVTASSGSRLLKATAAWPVLPVTSRLSAADLAAGTPKFRHASTPPPARYGVSPAVADLLTAAGVLLGLAALALVGSEAAALVARRRRLAHARLSPLEQALAYAREAARRADPADRRKALGLLSRALAREGDATLAGSAGGAAWAEEAPTPERTLELADEVRQPDPVESA